MYVNLLTYLYGFFSKNRVRIINTVILCWKNINLLKVFLFSCSGGIQEHLSGVLEEVAERAVADEFHEVFEEYMREQEQQQQTDNG